MVEINKFHEDREGCKSVMNKRKYNNLSSMGLMQFDKTRITIDSQLKA